MPRGCYAVDIDTGTVFSLNDNKSEFCRAQYCSSLFVQLLHSVVIWAQPKSVSLTGLAQSFIKRFNSNGVGRITVQPAEACGSETTHDVVNRRLFLEQDNVQIKWTRSLSYAYSEVSITEISE